MNNNDGRNFALDEAFLAHGQISGGLLYFLSQVMTSNISLKNDTVVK